LDVLSKSEAHRSSVESSRFALLAMGMSRIHQNRLCKRHSKASLYCNISSATIATHIGTIFCKLKIPSRSEAAVASLRLRQHIAS
jgi:DNA-binding CsgD family transcriptional regulator